MQTLINKSLIFEKLAANAHEVSGPTSFDGLDIPSQRFVDQDRFESISEACRAGLHRLEQDGCLEKLGFLRWERGMGRIEYRII